MLFKHHTEVLGVKNGDAFTCNVGASKMVLLGELVVLASIGGCNAALVFFHRYLSGFLS